MAFLYAPLWVPLIAVLVAAGTPPGMWQASGFVIVAVIAAVFGYVGMVIIGLPAYLFLRWRRWTSLWPAATAGFVAGLVMAILASLVLVGFRKSVLEPSTNDLIAGLVCAVVGVLVATTAWLIIRPDRAQKMEP